jgi:small subunit ribosomal protein S16
VAVKIKLKRMGKIREPYYRIVVADARTKRDGRAIEEIGKYHPKLEPSFIEVNSERAQHWLSVGAQPTDPVRKLLEITGDWQRFKGLPGAEGTLRFAAPRPDKKEIFAAALAETLGDTSAPKGKTRTGARTGEIKAGDAKTEKPARPAKAGAKAPEAKPAAAKAPEAKAPEAKPAAAKAPEAKAPEAKPAGDKAAEGESGDSKAKAQAEDAKVADPAPIAKEASASAESADVTASATPDAADAAPDGEATAKPGSGD